MSLVHLSLPTATYRSRCIRVRGVTLLRHYDDRLLLDARELDFDAALQDRQRLAWATTRHLPMDDIDQAPRWMRAWANQNPRVEKPVHHFGASLAPDDHLTREEWEAVAQRMLERLGLEEHQAILALHVDRDHEHLHIVVNRVGPDGRPWKPRCSARSH